MKKDKSKYVPTPEYKPNPETRAKKHKRLLVKITDQAAAPEYYEALRRGIESYTSHRTRDNEYSDICTDLRELQDFFYLQTLFRKEESIEEEIIPE